MEEVIINGEKLYLNKNRIFGWGVVAPIKVDGKINWKNLLIGGSWARFWILVFIMIVFFGSLSEYSTAVNVANECLANQQIIIIR